MKLLAFDLETHLFRPGLMAPPYVLASFANEAGAAWLALKSDGRALDFIKFYLADPETKFVGANIAYDFAIIAAEAAERNDQKTINFIFDAYEQGRVYDVTIAQALDAIAGGHLFADPRTGGSLRDPESGKMVGRYSLAICLDLCLGRKDAKRNDYWRMRYAILEQVPFDQWPAEAKQYPLDDAQNTLDVARWQLAEFEAGRFRNLGDMTNQARAAFALHLAACWGLRTEAEAVEVVAARVDKTYAADVEKFKELNLFKPDNKKDTIAIKRLVALAYGADPSTHCARCGGSGKVKGKTKKDIQCKASEGGCDATGLDLGTAPMLPRTETDGICADRDTLSESGDDTLEGLAKVSETAKLRETYVPFLRDGATHPINPRPNILVASGRTSYDGLIQLIPRGHGVRQCFVARPGYVFCSVDYNSLELSTLAQVCLWLDGSSRMAAELNAGKDLHAAFGAAMSGMDYDEFKAAVKAGDKKAKGRRQAAKAANFGFPGGMGAPRLVLSKRKEGLRFCQTLEGFTHCGSEKVIEWKGRPTTPICRRCVELAEQLRKDWFDQWPEMPIYFKIIAKYVDTSGELQQLGVDRVRGGVSFCDGANTLFQGLAADGAKNALWQVAREAFTDRLSPLWGTRPAIFVHDEIFSEMPIEKAHLAGPRKADLMIKAMKKFVPDVHVGAEPALMYRWDKDAEPVYDTTGKLVPWVPKTKEVVHGGENQKHAGASDGGCENLGPKIAGGVGAVVERAADEGA